MYPYPTCRDTVLGNTDCVTNTILYFYTNSIGILVTVRTFSGQRYIRHIYSMDVPYVNVYVSEQNDCIVTVKFRFVVACCK